MDEAAADGQISLTFASLGNEKEVPLPERFLELKRKLRGDTSKQVALMRSWGRLLNRLEEVGPGIEQQQQAVSTPFTFVPSPCPKAWF
jgi:hypothetical protein